MNDTIVALATPTGRSGIGVIRLSGAGSAAVAQQLITPGGAALEPRRAVVNEIIDMDGEVVDQAVITYFKGPHSFTGEDVIEISCHGSPVLLRRVLDMCLQHGARLAGAGEFTLRALGNGKLDLAKAEAIRDLIDAQTTASARQAVRQLRGELSNQLQPLKDDLLNVIVILESALEFVEDDLPDLQYARVVESLGNVAEETAKLAATFTAGRLIREGLRVALVGRPNVGKSSLFNALLGTDRAIVTEIAGTTRDQLHERFTVEDIPVSLVDTAGLRETTDLVESIGVQRSRSAIADADVVVVVIDASSPVTAEDMEVLNSVAGNEMVVAINKVDKVDYAAVRQVERHIDPNSQRHVHVSAKFGFGLPDLKRAIVEPFGPADHSGSGFLVSDARHHDLLLRTRSEIETSLEQLQAGLSEEIVLIGLHNALRFLGEITGETSTEDMLTRIFSTFCIGK
jgi:tRNA modification GTPase